MWIWIYAGVRFKSIRSDDQTSLSLWSYVISTWIYHFMTNVFLGWFYQGYNLISLTYLARSLNQISPELVILNFFIGFEFRVLDQRVNDLLWTCFCIGRLLRYTLHRLTLIFGYHGFHQATMLPQRFFADVAVLTN